MSLMFTGLGNLSYDSPKNRMIWLSLSFQAGTLNAGGYLAAHSFVTHTTGFATLFGEEVARGNFMNGVGMLTVPVFFLLGSMLAAFYVDRRIIRNHRPYYSHVLFLMTLFMGLITWIGVTRGFGEFGDPIHLKYNFAFLALLCLTSGLQNAIVTTAFGSTIRTTHLTGITTDLGLGLIRVLFNTHGSHSRRKEIKANWMRTSIIATFILGSLVSSMIFLKAQFWGFLIPVVISTSLWALSLYQNKHHKVEWHPFRRR